MEKEILRFEQVTGRGRKFPIQNVDFTMKSGYIYGLTGRNAEVLVEPAVAGAAQAALVTSKSTPSNILFLMVINSPLWGSVISVAYLSCHTI